MPTEISEYNSPYRPGSKPRRTRVIEDPGIYEQAGGTLGDISTTVLRSPQGIEVHAYQGSTGIEKSIAARSNTNLEFSSNNTVIFVRKT